MSKDQQIQVTMCGPQSKECKCQCPDGPCEHKWDGPDFEWQEGGSFCSSRSCSRCGMSAMIHDLWVSP